MLVFRPKSRVRVMPSLVFPATDRVLVSMHVGGNTVTQRPAKT